MKYLVFDLTGDFAMFKKPFTSKEETTELQLSYDHITPINVKGIIGAILGYKGLIHATREESSIEFLDKLKNIELGILPKDMVFEKQIQKITNTTGFANKIKSPKSGTTNIIAQEVLTDVSWKIVVGEFEDFDILFEKLMKNQMSFPITLGKNGMMAKFSNVEIIEDSTTSEQTVDSLVPLNCVTEKVISARDRFSSDVDMYSAVYPVDYNEHFEYITDIFSISNGVFKGNVLEVNDKKIGLFC